MSAPFHRVCAPLSDSGRSNDRDARRLAVAAQTNATITGTYTGPYGQYIMRPFQAPSASRFSDGTFGVHYSANSVDVAATEHAYHLARALREAHAQPMDLHRAHVQLRFAKRLSPIDAKRSELLDPADYSRSQDYGKQLHRAGSPGIRYPSVRYAGRGTCAGLFIPNLATDVQLVTEALPLTWDGTDLHLG